MATTNNVLQTNEVITQDIRLNPVCLSCDSNVERELRTPLTSEEATQFEQGHIGEYDKHTIFYDVFLKNSSKGDIEIVAIGPPLLNLRKHLLPFTVRIGEYHAELKEQFSNKKLVIFSVTVPPAAIDSAVNTLQIELSTAASHRFSLELDQPLAFSGASLITLQKNNRIDWIKDWANYYRSEFNIENVVVYDNSSDNQSDLIEQLALANIKVIRWNFPHGIAIGSSNKFCQVGQLNHFKWRFGSRSPIFNFDIDELLVCKDASTKSDILKGKLLRFNNYFVPHQNNLPEDYSFYHYNKRLSEPRHKAYKYSMAGHTPGFMNVHYMEKETSIPKKLAPESFTRGKIVAEDKAYFLHYRGITTNWKIHYTNKLQVDESVNTSVDNSVVNAFNNMPTTEFTLHDKR